jgi:CRP/FNR family transcriptional regulator, cyclic AMP receptor protein
MLANRRPDPYLDTLGQLRLFKGCSHAELVALGRHATPISIPAGRVLCREGTAGREAFVIVTGEAAVSLAGREIARLGPGDPCGEMAVLEGGPRTATVTALTPMEVLVLSSGDFRSLLSAAPTVTHRLLVTLSHRLRLADRVGTRR